jgi:hypothetical protein
MVSRYVLLGCVLFEIPALAIAETVPLPPERPAGLVAPGPALPEAVPLPPERPPEFAAPGPPGDAAAADDAVPEEERACQRRLTELGAAYTVLPALTGPGGCGAAHPLELTALTARVTVTGKPTVTCRLAEALALWARDGLPVAGEAAVTSVAVGTSYQCRGRNHDDTAPLSEHAFANGVDIAAFHLADGRTITVGTPVEEALQAAMRRAACTAFMTVLGPGSPGHGEHWHFDMRQRRNDYRICQ